VLCIVNGKQATLPDAATVAGYVSSLGLDPRAVIVELNESIVPRDAWDATALKEGDRLEIVAFVGGG